LNALKGKIYNGTLVTKRLLLGQKTWTCFDNFETSNGRYILAVTILKTHE